jgi:hypothetical protein
MDPYSTDIIARSRRQEFTDEADAARAGRAARECVDEPRPAPRPKRPATSPRRVAWLG